MVARFFVLLKSGFSLIFSLMKLPVRNRLDKLLHSLSAILFHLFRNMSVNIQRESRSGMAEIFLHGFNVVAAFDTSNCVCVPLRYNYDKPEKPRISRVFGYLARLFILFQTEKSSREVVIS